MGACDSRGSVSRGSLSLSLGSLSLGSLSRTTGSGSNPRGAKWRHWEAQVMVKSRHWDASKDTILVNLDLVPAWVSRAGARTRLQLSLSGGAHEFEPRRRHFDLEGDSWETPGTGFCPFLKDLGPNRISWVRIMRNPCVFECFWPFLIDLRPNRISWVRIMQNPCVFEGFWPFLIDLRPNRISWVRIMQNPCVFECFWPFLIDL